MLWELIYGLIIGAVISIPFGGIGTLCLSVSLTKGYKHGSLLALAIILGDAVLVFVGIIFYNMLSHIILEYESLFKIFTPVVLFVIGCKILYNVYKKKLHKKVDSKDSLKNIAMVFLLSLFNPATLIIIITIFKILHIKQVFYHSVFLSGFLISSISLWIIYILFMIVIKNNSNIKLLYRINKYIGFALCSIGFFLIVL